MYRRRIQLRILVGPDVECQIVFNMGKYLSEAQGAVSEAVSDAELVKVQRLD